MLHPVGTLPAHVYWRRRVVMLVVLLALLGGAGWLGFTLLAGRDGGDAAASDTTVPEPATLVCVLSAALLVGVTRRSRS